MKVLVTGGAGFIGSHTVDLLLARGHSVRILDALAPPVHRDGAPPDYLPPEAELIHGDVRSRGDWERALDGVEAVFHFAAYQDYLPDFAKFFHVNAAGTALLYEVAVEQRLPLHKIVVASSQAVYGEGRYRCPRDGAQYPGPRSEAQLRAGNWEPRCPVCGDPMQAEFASEADALHPHNSYAMSKQAQEMLALKLGERYNLPTVALRYSITQGARQSYRNAYSGAMRIFAMQALAGQPLTVYEDGQQLRDFVYVGDVARANLLVFEDPRAAGQVFNVGSGRAGTVLAFAECLAERAGTGSQPRVTGEYRFGDTRHIVSDITRLRALGWEPRGSLAANVDEYLAWASQQPDFRNYADEARAYMRQVGTVRGR
ncbi:MAG: NAD-dependent epimerase/dehydratase family protein [Anaerolineales bacterium]|nr:NAD-dependent epimerase/dehydratase family protein [Anaerolineales bacterium]